MNTVSKAGDKRMNRWLVGLLMIGIAPLSALADEASTYPDRLIHIVVPFVAGGTGDVLARRIGGKLAQHLSQPVLIENRAGANTSLASEYVAKAAADGYTLYSTNTSLIQVPMLYASRYDEARDFVPVAQYASIPLVLAVRAEIPAKNFKELVAYLKARPGKTSYGSNGAGGTQHIYSEALKRAAGVDSVHIPYKGESPLLTDFLGGRLDWYIASPITIMQYVRSGKIRLLAVTGDQRLPLAPDVPTFKEEGMTDLTVVGWMGLFAPSKTPKPIVAKLSKALADIVRSPEVSDYLRESGMIPTGLDAMEFREKLPSFREAFLRMIRENNIKVE